MFDWISSCWFFPSYSGSSLSISSLQCLLQYYCQGANSCCVYLKLLPEKPVLQTLQPGIQSPVSPKCLWREHGSVESVLASQHVYVLLWLWYLLVGNLGSHSDSVSLSVLKCGQIRPSTYFKGLGDFIFLLFKFLFIFLSRCHAQCGVNS